MTPLARLPLATKLPAMMVLLALAGMIAFGALSFLSVREMSRKDCLSDLAAQADAVARGLQARIGDLRDRASALGTDPATLEALLTLGGGLRRDPAAALQDADALRQGDRAADRAGPDQGEGGSSRAAGDALLHPRLRSMAMGHDVSDILLVSEEGEVIYSLQVSPGFVTSLRAVPSVGGHLGQVVREALVLAPGATTLTDFAPLERGGDQAAAFVATPLAGPDGRARGVLVLQVPLSALADTVQDAAPIGETGALYVLATDGTTRIRVGSQGNIATFTPPPALPQVEAAVAGRAEELADTMGLDGAPALAVVRPLDIEGLRWSIVAEIDRSVAFAGLNALGRDLLLCLAGVAFAITMLGWTAARRVTLPLARIAASMRAVSDRRPDLPIPDLGRADELGDLARALMAFRDELARADALAAEREAARVEQDRMVTVLGAALSRLAEGDLTQPVGGPFVPAYERLRDDLDATMTRLSSILVLVVRNAAQISQKAQEISGASDDLSRRTESQAATLEQTAAALDQLTAGVRSAAQGAAEVDGIVGEARSEAERSGAVVRDAVAAMAEIERSSNEISQIIGVIDDIAFQTNLLALNAGVEAARAGEAGRGFAVVASEVRTLAQRSSEAAKQIKTLIGGSTQQVRQGVALVDRAGGALTSILDRVAHISELVSDIAIGVREQAAGLGEINGGVNQLDQVTQQNAAMVEQSAAATHALTQDAQALAEIVSRFRLREPVLAEESGSPLRVAPRLVAARGGHRQGTSIARLEATTGRLVAESLWNDV